jgi:hypothetical protein
MNPRKCGDSYKKQRADELIIRALGIIPGLIDSYGLILVSPSML